MRLKLEYRWIEGCSWLLPNLLFLWALFVLVVATVRYLAGDVVGPILCIPLFITAIYIAIAHAVNRTILVVTPTHFEIVHEPVPWFGDKILSVSDIKSFSFKERGSAEGRSTFFRFYCDMIDQKHNTIFSGVHIGKPERAISVITKAKVWLEPYSNIEFLKVNSSWQSTR